MPKAGWIVATSLAAAALSACGPLEPQETPTATAEPNDNVTRIVIDGSGGDWARYAVSAVDPAGDHPAGSPDLGEIKAFTNDQYLYMFLAFQDGGRFDHLYFNVSTQGGGQYQLTLSGGGAKIEDKADGSVEAVAAEYAQAQGYEFRLPLSAVQNRAITRVLVNVWLGSENGDTADVGTVRALLEVDVVAAASGEAAPTPEEQTAPAVPPYIANMRFMVPGIRAENVYSVSARPWSVVIGPDDQILLLGDPHTIYQLGDDGQTSVYSDLSNVGDTIEQFGFDPEARLWVSTNHSGTFRIDSQGRPVKVTGPVNRVFDIDSQGNLYAVDYPATNVQKITPEGEVLVLAEGFGQAHKIAVTNEDEVLIVEDSRGELILIHADGTWETIVDGLTFDFGVAVSPQGAVYLIDWSGLYEVDLLRKTKTRLEWYQSYSNTGESAVFDGRGYMYTFHPNLPIYRIDLDAQTVELVFHPRGNSFAMAVGAGGRAFIAYDDRIPGGHSTLYEIGSDNSLVALAEFPFREARWMSFGTDGRGMVSLKGPEAALSDSSRDFHAGAVFAFNPDTGETEQILEDCCSSLDSITQSPADGAYWWQSWDGIHVLDASGQTRRVPYPEGGIGNGRLEFAPDGRLYALFYKNNISNLVADRQVYRLGADKQWELLYSGSEFILDIAVCTGDTIYTMGYTTEFSAIAPNRSGNLYLLWQVAPDGKLIPLAYDVGGDQFAIQCDPATNDLFFTHIDGVGKFIFDLEG